MSRDKSSEYVCVRCAALGQTCCGLGEAGGPVGAGAVVEAPAPDAECFPVSAAERQRIEAALRELTLSGLSESQEFPLSDAPFSAHENTPEFIEAMCGLFPGRRTELDRLYPAGGQHLRMKLEADGRCLLLGAHGCILPPEARPWFCRIFPFWVRRGSLCCFTPEDCLAVRESANMRQLLKAFGQEPEDVLRLFANLKRDWGLR